MPSLCGFAVPIIAPDNSNQHARCSFSDGGSETGDGAVRFSELGCNEASVWMSRPCGSGKLILWCQVLPFVAQPGDIIGLFLNYR